MKNIYDYIEAIKKRPSMYVRNSSLEELQTLLWGYSACLQIHEIREVSDGRPFDSRDFSDWILRTYGWSTCAGWAYAINQEQPDPDKAFTLFFELLSEFRNSA